MPFSLFFDTSAISPFGACARTVFCTAGGSSLNFCDAFSTLWLQPTTRPAAASKLMSDDFILSFLTRTYSRHPMPKVGLTLLCYEERRSENATERYSQRAVALG